MGTDEAGIPRRYVDEFSGRHNYRPKDTIDQMSKLVAQMAGKQLRYAYASGEGRLVRRPMIFESLII